MNVYIFVLWCGLLSSVAAFTIPDNSSEYSQTGSFIETAASQDCKCKNGRCVTDNRGKTKCNCAPGYALQDDFTCEICNCGEKGRCIFMPQAKSSRDNQFVKKCICDIGSAEKDGSCIDCHCGEHSKCEFEGEEKVCYCIDGFSEKEGVCTECNCGFFGECKFEQGRKKCICDKGFVEKEGHCRAICDEVDCGIDAECHFDTDNNIPTCACKMDGLVFDRRSKKCKETCESFGEFKRCQNGAICKEQETGNFCICRSGTSGFFCENVDVCNSMDCGTDAACKFDIATHTAKCFCVDAELTFDAVDRKCKSQCDDYFDSRPCRNGGDCEKRESGNFCSCRDGTSGFFCEIVDACSDMDCGQDAVCEFSIEAKGAVCKCKADDHRFDEAENKCKEKCSMYRTCRNGGTCMEGICYCFAETSGDFCEVIQACDYLCPKQRDINCTFDDENGKAFCKCTDGKLGYDPEIRQCRHTCSGQYECENGGSCERDEYAQFCSCLDGTTGDFCQEVIGCNTKDCGDHAKCVYDVNKQMAVCVCEDERYAFDPVLYKCRATCDEYSSLCMNSGACQERGHSRFCKCLTGTDGDFCEKIPGCQGKDCGSEAECAYDANRGSPICMCHDRTLSFDSMDSKCKKSCHDDTDCKNGGRCAERENDKFCICLRGTVGDACEIVIECEDKDHRKCQGESDCAYDIRRKSAFCQCRNHSKKYDLLSEKCKITCDSHATCSHSGLCMPIEDHSFCRCKIGTSGELCEKVDECEKGACGDTDATICKYDVERETVKCECKAADALYDEVTKTCRTCDCGKNTISCKFEDGEKLCVCPEGFGVENGICKKKWCVEKICLNGKCEIIGDREVCSCFEGYELDGNYCKKLNCTNTPCVNGTCVVRHGNIEECVCPAGFTLDRGRCIRGLCKPETCFGGRCETIEGELICICPDKFHLEGIGCYETVCEIQRCFGGKCVVEDEKEICTCREGYLLKNDVCKQILCEKKNCFGGQCHIVDGEEECTCPVGFSIFEDVCREDLTPE